MVTRHPQNRHRAGHYPSPLADELCQLITTYAICPPQKESECFAPIENMLATIIANPDDASMILDRDDAGNTLLRDSVVIPQEYDPKGYDGTAEAIHTLQIQKARKLLSRLTQFCHDAMERKIFTPALYADLVARPPQRHSTGITLLGRAVQSGDKAIYDTVLEEIKGLEMNRHIPRQQLAELFTVHTVDQHTLLHEAILSGNQAIYNSVVSELKALRDGGAITDANYATQFTLWSKDDHVKPLHSIALSGDPEWFKGFIADLKDAFAVDGTFHMEDYKQELRDANHTANANMLQCAASTHGRPEAVVKEMGEIAIDELRHVFGNEASKIMAQMMDRKVVGPRTAALRAELEKGRDDADQTPPRQG